MLDEAVRDGLIPINPAKNRAKRSLNRNAFRIQPAEQASPRARHPRYGHLDEARGRLRQNRPVLLGLVMLAALLAARSSEVSGLQTGDVRFDKNPVVIARQTYPGKGGLITKQTKGRKERRIFDKLRPILDRLTEGKEPEDHLLVGPKGGALTTATVRDATNWDQIAEDLGLPDLTLHGLRHTAAKWMADAGIPLHVLQEHPRPRLRRNHPRLPAPRRPAPRISRRAGERLPRPLGEGRGTRLAARLHSHCRCTRSPVPPLWSPF
ncbi:tyrosine-type recombinase/integrase [Gordonia sp. ABSL11-1]|uniref:tyrosine-type recombinase/integrase n=1 Tax=Gordonia sp. ABSL11-1 TaxID=3053924 RepID=UPI002573DA8A|nr:tyrosine-type recombinase/integrase [Gordonia sp. ABSL11-1]MDL9946759.1 tyrosine-type recombinase/integrase [Gordonia sp. ABSL11-1]